MLVLLEQCSAYFFKIFDYILDQLVSHTFSLFLTSSLIKQIPSCDTPLTHFCAPRIRLMTLIKDSCELQWQRLISSTFSLLSLIKIFAEFKEKNGVREHRHFFKDVKVSPFTAFPPPLFPNVSPPPYKAWNAMKNDTDYWRQQYPCCTREWLCCTDTMELQKKWFPLEESFWRTCYLSKIFQMKVILMILHILLKI